MRRVDFVVSPRKVSQRSLRRMKAADLRAQSSACNLPAMRPQDDPSWHAYGDTILEFLPGADPVRVDLRKAVTEPLARMLATRGLPGTFVVVTACNPRGHAASDAENVVRTAVLRQTLDARQLAWIPADGLSPDGTHREPGVAVAMSHGDAQALAREFEQSAIYRYDGEAFWLVGALVDAVPMRLPLLI